MTKLKKIAVIVIAIPVILIAAAINHFFFPKTHEYTSGVYEDLVVGENKINLISRLKDTKHGFIPLPLDPDRDRNWVLMESMSNKEYGLLLKSDVWRAGNIGYSEECRCAHTMMYFKSDKLTKIKVECRACK